MGRTADGRCSGAPSSVVSGSQRSGLRRWAVVVVAALLTTAAWVGAGASAPAAASSTVAHVPVASVTYRSEIVIEATVDCTAPDCAGTLYYRTSDPTATLPPLDAYAAVPMTMTPVSGTEGQNVFTATGVIPSAAVDTRGVDYLFSIVDGTTMSWFPGVDTGCGVSVGPVTVTGSGGSPIPQHVHVREPIHAAHEPVPLAYLHEPIEVAVQATCATETCSAELSYRISDGLNTVSGIVDNADTGLAGEGFTAVAMSATVLQDLGAEGRVLEFTATIPAEVVTTDGVDYFVRSFDGYTTAWFPGTSYVGSVEPVDGERTGWVHVEVFSRPLIAHVPPAYYVPGQALQVDAEVTSATGFPEVTLFYRQGSHSGFASLPMTVRETPVRRPEGTVYVATGGIPGSYTAQGGSMVYTIAVDDGFQTTFSPPRTGVVDTNLGYIVTALSEPL